MFTGIALPLIFTVVYGLLAVYSAALCGGAHWVG